MLLRPCLHSPLSGSALRCLGTIVCLVTTCRLGILGSPLAATSRCSGSCSCPSVTRATGQAAAVLVHSTRHYGRASWAGSLCSTELSRRCVQSGGSYSGAICLETLSVVPTGRGAAGVVYMRPEVLLSTLQCAGQPHGQSAWPRSRPRACPAGHSPALHSSLAPRATWTALQGPTCSDSSSALP